MSHELQEVTDRKKIRGFARSITWRPDDAWGKIIELRQCVKCRLYWECVREYFEPDGSIKHHCLRLWIEERALWESACETVPAPAESS